MPVTRSQNEAFSRVLIDKALEASGWDLLDPRQVQFELNTASGRADYLLKDSLARVLCVLEAKREDVDPYDAKEQARGYAENLNAPFVLMVGKKYEAGGIAKDGANETRSAAPDMRAWKGDGDPRRRLQRMVQVSRYAADSICRSWLP